MSANERIEGLRAPAKVSTVFLIDDDPSARRGLARLIQAAGYAVATFGSARDFLASARNDAPGCMVLDIRMPELSGLDLQEQLLRADYSMPIIFITGHGDIPMTVQAMKRGAIDFLPKPVEREQLLEAIRQALEKDRVSRSAREESKELRERLQLLKTREREVLSFVIAGFLNKQIASELGITEATVKVHRARLMDKLRVTSVAELVTLAQKAGFLAAKRATP
jgi:RNA polymerase sigma factor (sigma-70 family)